jgi:hypothetical protein
MQLYPNPYRLFVATISLSDDEVITSPTKLAESLCNLSCLILKTGPGETITIAFLFTAHLDYRFRPNGTTK